MPSNYAHHRFGNLAASELPEQLRLPVQRFRRLYDVGQHGPDLFFNYNIFFHTPIGNLGTTLHDQSGRVFFTRVCKRVRQDPSEAAIAYLFGLLGHYCLDSICHPFIHEMTDEGEIGHVELETEFDRYLMELDGKTPAHKQDFSRHMKLSRAECLTAAPFFPPCKWLNIWQASHNMALHAHLLATADHRLAEKVLSMAGKDISQQLMPLEENTHCSHLDAHLMELYGQALERYPEMIRQLSDHLEKNAPLGEDFTPTFG